MTDDRTLDVVLLGATGFTGGLTAEYLAGHAPSGCRWALAGRSQDQARGRPRPPGGDRPRRGATCRCSTADVHRRRRRSVPWPARPGCWRRRSGPTSSTASRWSRPAPRPAPTTLDLTGEPEFVDRMYARPPRRGGPRPGARLVHCCGFDSIPHDLGVLVHGQAAAGRRPAHACAASSGRRGLLRRHLRLGAGAVRAVEADARRGRASAVPSSPGRKVDGPAVVAGSPRRDPVLGYWLLPLPTIDPIVVKRSAAARGRLRPGLQLRALRRLHPPAGRRWRRRRAWSDWSTAAQVGPLRSLLL